MKVKGTLPKSFRYGKTVKLPGTVTKKVIFLLDGISLMAMAGGKHCVVIQRERLFLMGLRSVRRTWNGAIPVKSLRVL